MKSKIEKELWDRVNRYIYFLQIVPFIKMIAVCNTLAFGIADENSDIDLFIVAKSNRLFIVRIFVTFLLHLMGVRRHGNKIKQRFCLSFFVDENSLNLKKIALHNDYYLSLWINKLNPVIEENGFYNKFLSENNWINEYLLLNPKNLIDRDHIVTKSRVLLSFKRFNEFLFKNFIGSIIENSLKKWQLKRAYKKSLNIDNRLGIIMNEHILKFHNNDRRPIFNKKLEKYIIDNKLPEDIDLKTVL